MSSRFIFSLNLKRFERRKSIVAVFGRRKLLRGMKNARVGPPEPSRPFAVPPTLPDPPLINSVTVLPEAMVTMGAIWKPLKIAFPAPDLAKSNVFSGCQTALATKRCGMSRSDFPTSEPESKPFRTVGELGEKVEERCPASVACE